MRTLPLVLLSLLGAPAFAQSGPPEGWTEVPLEPVAAPSEPGTDEGEIVVWGTKAVRGARNAIIDRMRALGWEEQRTRADGSIVFSGPEPWMGSALLSRDGMIQFRRRWAWVDPVRAVEAPPGNSPGALDNTVGMQGGGASTSGGLHGPASKEKVRHAQDALLRGVHGELTHYRDVLAETALRQRLEVLPDRLDRLWNAGEPMGPGPVLATTEARKQAVLDYWATRPHTREGRMTCAVVEDWIAGTVQPSETPYTEAALAAAAARRGPGWHPLPRE